MPRLEGEISAVGYTVIDDEGHPNSVLWSPVPDSLAVHLGAIIVNWGLADRIAMEFTQAMIGDLNRSFTGWRTQETGKRFRLHCELFTEMFGAYEDLVAYHHKEIVTPFWKAKRVRDKIAHDHVMYGYNKNGEGLRFLNPAKPRDNRKVYSQRELRDIAHSISAISGSITNLAEAEERLPISSSSIQALQRFLGKDRWNSAINAALPPQL